MPRRGRNIGKRKKTFVFRMMVKGRLIRQSLGTNLKEAKRRASLLREQYRAEVNARQNFEPMKVASFSVRWLTEYVELRRNREGAQLAASRLSQHVVPVLGDRLMAEVDMTDLRRLRIALEAKRPCAPKGKRRYRKRDRLSPQSVRHVLSEVRCLFRYAVEVGVLTASPFRSSLLPRIPEEAPRRLSDEDVDRILTATGERYDTAVRLGLLTGLRWGEIHRLQWRNLVAKPAPHLVLDRTKSGRVRRVPLVPEAVEVLARERSRTTSVFVLPFRAKNPCAFVGRIGERAGVRWHFHQLRHTFACRWLEAGGSKEALQRILGHSTIRLTERYGELSDDSVFREARRLTIRSGHITSHQDREVQETL